MMQLMQMYAIYLNPAASPKRSNQRTEAANGGGAPHSDVNTNDDAGSCSRLSRRKAGSSRPDSGCTEAAELTRLTCKRPWAIRAG
jgi:hypothetical protein